MFDIDTGDSEDVFQPGWTTKNSRHLNTPLLPRTFFFTLLCLQDDFVRKLCEAQLWDKIQHSHQGLEGIRWGWHLLHDSWVITLWAPDPIDSSLCFELALLSSYLAFSHAAPPNWNAISSPLHLDSPSLSCRFWLRNYFWKVFWFGCIQIWVL